MFSVEPGLILSLPEVGFILKLEHHKSYILPLRTLEGIKQFLHAPNPIAEGLGVWNAIIDRWIVTSESLKHMGVFLLSLFFVSPHHFLQVFVLLL